MQWAETTILKAEFFTPLCTLGSNVTQAVKILYLTNLFFFFLKVLDSFMPLQHQALTLQGNITLY